MLTKKFVISLFFLIFLLIFPFQNKMLAAGVVGDGSIDSTVTIDDRITNGPTLSDDDYYTISVTSIGDLDGDGVSDIAVGADGDDGAGTDQGTVHIHFLNTDGSVDSTVEINGSTTNGPTLANGDYYGHVTSIGDLDGDGVSDIAVGAPGDDTGGDTRGAVYIHFMNTDGSIDSTVKIDDTTANGPILSDEDSYGFGIASIGDLNGDGVSDLAVGAYDDDAGGTSQGALHIHFMNTDGSIDSTVEINGSTTNGPTLVDSDYYGISIASIGDLNGDGVNDLVVGAAGGDSGGSSIFRGSIFIHFMNTDGSIDSTIEIDDNTANGPALNDGDIYGFSVTSIGDLDRDGVTDLAVGAPLDDAGGTDRGTVHIHFMNADGSIDSTVEINNITTNGSTLLNSAYYGVSVASIGDLNGDGTNDLAIGAEGADAGGELGSGRGTLFIHFMHGETETNTFDEDKRCHWKTPPEITWIKLIPEIKDDIEGMLVTWVQYDADKVDIAIDDGTGNFPWKLSKTSNDGHEFLPNVTSAQQIKIKPHNHCRKGEYSISVSYNFYPDGWYNIP